MSENNETPVVELPKPSKLKRIKSASFKAAVIIIPTAVTVGGMIASYKMSKMQYDTAKLNLENAKLTKS